MAENLSQTISGFDSELVRAFHESILSSLVYIERFCVSTGESVSGTGTVIGWQGNKADGWLPLIATAGHIIRGTIGIESRFRLSRYSFIDPAHPTVRTAEFESGTSNSHAPCAIYYSGPQNELQDIGFIRGPINCTDGNPFFSNVREGFPSGESTAIETDWYWAAEGTKVAWAGFPALVAEIAQRPQPCYYEGVVSGLILRDDFCAYLLDGHNTLGISGGPVWAVDSKTMKSRIIAVISSYRFRGDATQLPGLVHAAPIQPLRIFLEKNWGAKPLGYIRK